MFLELKHSPFTYNTLHLRWRLKNPYDVIISHVDYIFDRLKKEQQNRLKKSVKYKKERLQK